MATERILITVRTYPNPSTKYLETVCTGGINQVGEWRRLYPVQWRWLDDAKQYRQYDVIETFVRETAEDSRPESRKIDASTIRLVESLKKWENRCSWVRPTVVPSMNLLKDRGFTLRPVHVDTVLDFLWEGTDPEWTVKQKSILEQEGLFDGPKPLEKIPFVFRLEWRDGEGVKHRSKFIDWEVCEAWRNFNRKYPDPLKRLREKWMDERFASDRYVAFYMGNYAGHPQHYGVCGVYCPPKAVHDEQQLW